MSESEAQKLLPEIPGWELVEHASKLRRSFSFANFMDAQDFACKAGELAEANNHHPDISYGWGYCTVVYYTHKIKGLHPNDFIMAAKTNALPHS